MMKLNKRSAREDEKEGVIRTIKWCKANNLLLAGLPYRDDLAGSSGIFLEAITPPGTSNEHLRQAIREGYQERDVVHHGILECPLRWFMEADGKTFDRELIHNYVVAYGRGGPSSEAYELAEKWFWQGKAESDIAFEIFFRGLTVQEEVEQNGG